MVSVTLGLIIGGLALWSLVFRLKTGTRIRRRQRLAVLLATVGMFAGVVGAWFGFSDPRPPEVLISWAGMALLIWSVALDPGAINDALAHVWRTRLGTRDAVAAYQRLASKRLASIPIQRSWSDVLLDLYVFAIGAANLLFALLIYALSLRFRG